MTKDWWSVSIVNFVFLHYSTTARASLSVAEYLLSAALSFLEKYPMAEVVPSSWIWLSTPPTWLLLASVVTIKFLKKSALTNQWGLYQFCLKGFKRLLAFLGPLKLHIWSGQVSEWGSHLSKILNMFPIKPAHANETSYLLYFGGRFHPRYCFFICRIWTTAVFLNSVT